MEEGEHVVADPPPPPPPPTAALSPKLRKLIPFVEVLRVMKPEHRIILFEHLSDGACGLLYEIIGKVLAAAELDRRRRLNLALGLKDHKDQFRYLANAKRGRAKKRKYLVQVGGGPMTKVLGAALPMLLAAPTRRRRKNAK